MDLRKYLLSNVLRYPEVEAGAAEAPPVETLPAVVAEGETPAPEPEVIPEPEPAPKPRTPDPLINTITGLRAKNRDIENELLQERQARQAAEALAQRLSRGEGNNPPQQHVTLPAPTEEAEIDRRAEYKLFARDVESMRSNGLKQYGAQFNDTIRALNAVGADNDAFVSQVMAVDPQNAHILLNSIAQDLERAVSLVGMDPTRRIAELTRMAMAATAAAEKPTNDGAPPPAPVTPKPAPKVVSKAPAPAPAVTPSASKVVDWRQDDASDEDFDRGFKEMMAKRSARR